MINVQMYKDLWEQLASQAVVIKMLWSTDKEASEKMKILNERIVKNTLI